MSRNIAASYPLSTDDGGEDFAAVLEADEESSVGSHPSNKSYGEADQGQIGGNGTAAEAAKAGADEEGEQGPTSAGLGNDEGNRPARDLAQGAQEVTHVDVALAHVRRVLHHSIVTEEASHAVRYDKVSINLSWIIHCG